MMIIRRCLPTKDGGTLSVQGNDPSAVLNHLVQFAINSEERPPKWWHFWARKWPEDAVRVYSDIRGKK